MQVEPWCSPFPITGLFHVAWRVRHTCQRFLSFHGCVTSHCMGGLHVLIRSQRSALGLSLFPPCDDAARNSRVETLSGPPFSVLGVRPAGGVVILG